MGNCGSTPGQKEQRHVQSPVLHEMVEQSLTSPLKHQKTNTNKKVDKVPEPVKVPEPEALEPPSDDELEFECPWDEIRDGRGAIEFEEREERELIRHLRLMELPKEHRIKKFLSRSVARWKFNTLRDQLFRQQKVKQRDLAVQKVGSIHIAADLQASGYAHGIVIKRLVDSPQGGKGIAELAGLHVNDVLVHVRYDDAKTGGEVRTAEALDHPEDLRRAVGPTKEVYEGTVLIFSYLRGAAQVKAWNKTLHQPQIELIVDEIEKANNHNARAALTLKLCKQRLALLEQAHIPAHEAEVVVGKDTHGAEAGRKKEWARIKECGVLCVGDLDLDSVEAYLSNPEQAMKMARVQFDEMDKDKSGSLDPDEIYCVFKALAKADGLPEPSTAEARSLFRRVDLDGNGSISFEEFYPFFRRRVVEIICSLEKDMTDHHDGVWVPKSLDEAKIHDVRKHIEKEYRAREPSCTGVPYHPCPEEFTTLCLNKRWKCTARVTDGMVHVIATSRDGLDTDDTTTPDFVVEAVFSAHWEVMDRHWEVMTK